jgi:5-methylcytosine-specific restriction protein B
MASLADDTRAAAVLDSASTWIRSCLIEDGSVLSGDKLWTLKNVEAVQRAFVDHPREGNESFIDKLRGQFKDEPAAATQLMAEMLWALSLFPSNVGAETKRQLVEQTWSLSGAPLHSDHPQLSDSVLSGIGSGGPGFNMHRWRELVFLIKLTANLKRLTLDARRQALTQYDSFFEWIVPLRGTEDRQFRHMLRYFAFPERVERMSSNRDRRAILSAYGVASESEMKRWDDRRLDEALLTLRREMETKHPGQVLDFYRSPLVEHWRPTESDEGESSIESADSGQSARDRIPASSTAKPINLILYGPPGTGKTHWLRDRFNDYTELPSEVSEEAWLVELVSSFGWREVVATAMASLREHVRVAEVAIHPLVKAKLAERTRGVKNLQATIWACLQTHTPESVITVNYKGRRPPFLFSKSDDATWSLLKDWEEQDVDASRLNQLYRAGRTQSGSEVRRYRVVTFHPSYGYEDFIRGIRPTAVDDGGENQFQLVDGVFKRLCDEALKDPAHRYAIFIDEINRANIAKVFGELITLIEPDKRIVVDADGRWTSGMTVQLPGGQDSDVVEPPFGVPANLDIYGTMNTADRSIALLDIALRRRFVFQEMEPRYDVLDRRVGEIDLARLLRSINERLEYLLDRDHRVGHAYFMPVNSVDDLRAVFRNQVIPLLQEYFFDDLSRVAMVLATRASTRFVTEDRLQPSKLFPDVRKDSVLEDRWRYRITDADTWSEATFIGLYGEPTSDGLAPE